MLYLVELLQLPNVRVRERGGECEWVSEYKYTGKFIYSLMHEHTGH